MSLVSSLPGAAPSQFYAPVLPYNFIDGKSVKVFLVTVKMVTLIFLYGIGIAILSAQEGRSDNIDTVTVIW